MKTTQIIIFISFFLLSCFVFSQSGYSNCKHLMVEHNNCYYCKNCNSLFFQCEHCAAYNKYNKNYICTYCSADDFGMTDQKVNEAQILIKQFSFFINAYFIEYNFFPTFQSDKLMNYLNNKIENLNVKDNQIIDVWGSPISYSTDSTIYCIKSNGPDKTVNTKDDIQIEGMIPTRH